MALAVTVIILSFVSSFLLSRASVSVAKKFDIIDHPKTAPTRKSQTKPVPLLGATGLIVTSSIFSFLVWLTSIYNWFGLSNQLQTNLEDANFGWVLISILILAIGGYIDDKYNLKPKYLAIHITLALLVAIIFGGLQIEALSFPFDQVLPNNSILPYILSFGWLGLCTASTKFLDGLDGLVSTVGIIAFFVIASISFFPNVFQPFTIIISLIWLASLIGYLPYNFPDARSYLGEGGSEIIGFMIGVLSILSGAKVATVSMVIGWFIIDIIFVIFLRISQKKNPLKGDRLHWHFRLQDLGLSKHKVLVLTTGIILLTAHLGLILPTSQKAIVLVLQIVVLLSVFTISLFFQKKKPSKRVQVQ